jgi:bacteriocin-like protein
MKNFEELSFEEMQRVEGGEPISIALGICALVIAVGSVCVWAYNNKSSMVNGFNDGRSGNYNAPSPCN